MYEMAIKMEKVGKMYRLYKRPIDKVLDAFNLNFWRKNYYEEFWALRSLDLEIKKGERLGIIGRNGAGKSTLLKIITGNIAPTEGNIRVNGRIQALMELGTGFHPEFTGRQNIRASLAYHGLSNKEIRQKEEEIIDFAELEDFIDRPVKTYSAGMYARLAFSTATAVEPEILIIDEVLGAGDAYFAGKCVERMRRLTEDSGATVLFVSHDLNSVIQLCDRAIWIDRGRIQISGDPLKVIKDYSIKVRKDEEIRLRAREQKVLKKQALLLDREEDLYQPLLFHFISNNNSTSAQGRRIFNIKLIWEHEEIGSIDVGGPMDNSPQQLHYIMDTKGYMDWGLAQKGEHGMFREYKDLQSKYKHAPFIFSIPKEIIGKADYFTLVVEASNDVGDMIIEGYNGNKYIPIGSIGYCQKSSHVFKVPNIFNVNKQETVEKKEFFKLEHGLPVEGICETCLDVVNNESTDYGTKEAKIVSVRMLDHKGRDTRVFETGKPLKVVFDYSAGHQMIRPVFVFCVYLPDGRCATQWVASEKIYGSIRVPAKGCFEFNIDNLSLGKGKYIASAAIFKKMPTNGIEPESYHVIDRSIHFEVFQPVDDTLERGICIQNFRTNIS
ncbi:hypothetical protein JCM14036_06660 [Desulfotomaculum defluvii]